MKQLNVLKTMQQQALLMGCVGIAAGIVYSFGGLIIDLQTTGLNEGTALAFLALLGMPIIGAGFGIATGFVGALVHNTIVKLKF